jgi:hypothetical protein
MPQLNDLADGGPMVRIHLPPAESRVRTRHLYEIPWLGGSQECGAAGPGRAEHTGNGVDAGQPAAAPTGRPDQPPRAGSRVVLLRQ